MDEATESDSPRAMLQQADGKIVVVGQSGNLGTNPDMAIARFNETGLALDSSFGTDGKLTVDFFGGRDGAEAVVQQADGKLVVGVVCAERSGERVRRGQGGAVAGPQLVSAPTTLRKAAAFPRNRRRPDARLGGVRICMPIASSIRSRGASGGLPPPARRQ